MYARAALVALIVVVGIRVTCGAVSSVAFHTEIALAVSIFIKVLGSVFANVTALVADGIRNIECKVITSFLCCNLKKLCILCL